MTNNFEYFVSDIHSDNLGRFWSLCDKANAAGFELFAGEVSYPEVKEYYENKNKYPLGYKIRHIFRRKNLNVG